MIIREVACAWTGERGRTAAHVEPIDGGTGAETWPRKKWLGDTGWSSKRYLAILAILAIC